MKNKRRNNSKTDIFKATNSLKVLSCLAEKPGKDFLGTEIAKATGISRAGVYLALKELVKQRLITVTKQERFFFYSIIYDDAVVRQFKALKNVLSLRLITAKLRPFCRKIILYGSCSRGENNPESDIDLFIIAKDPERAKDAIVSVKTKQKVQAVIKTASEIAGFKDSEKTFMREVDCGIVLWEGK